MIARSTTALSPAERRASEDDRAWFARNPERCLRLRDPIPGEAEALSAACGVPLPHHHGAFALKIVAVCMNERVRARTPVYTDAPPDMSEPVVAALLDVLEGNRAAGFDGPVTLAELGEALGLATVTRH